MVELEPDPQRVAAIAEAFARALDAEDYGTARSLVADECVYARGDQDFVGPSAIVDSYAEVGSWVRRTFEEFRYESRIEPLGEGRAELWFTDYLYRPPARWHRHRSRQIVTVSAAGRIVRIAHHEMPGEREAVMTFLEATGTPH